MLKIDKILIVLFLTFLPALAVAQGTATIRGKIVDGENGEELIAATVVLKDQNDKIITGAQTKFDGTYLIKKVKPGTYKLVVNYVGYEPTTVENLEVKPGDELKFDLGLRPDAVMTEEVIVEARALKNNAAAMLKERQKAASSQDAITEEEFSKKGVSDAGEALKKVTGVTIKDNKNVVVRGLSNRYAKTQLNGAALPSADPDSRSVDLDMFSTGMIENIVTIKTATPDKPGDFTGGAVDIKTKSYPDEFFVNVGFSTNYNFQVTGNDLLMGERQSSDWLGYDAGNRDMPGGVRDLLDKYGGDIPGIDQIFELDGEKWVDVNGNGLRYIDENNNGIRDREPFEDANGNGRWDSGESYEDLNNSGRYDFAENTFDETEFFDNREIISDHDMMVELLNQNDMNPVTLSAPVNTGFSFGIGNQYKIGKSTPIGFNANLNYNRSFNSYQDGVFGNWELTSFRDDSLNILDYYREQQGQENVLLSGMFGVTTTLFDYNEIGVNLIYNQASSNEGRFFNGYSPGGSGIPDKGIYSLTNRFIERDLYSFQLSGKHKFNFLESINLGDTKLDWQITSSENRRSEPNFRLLAYTYEAENLNDRDNIRPDVDTLVYRAYDPAIDGEFEEGRDSLRYTTREWDSEMDGPFDPMTDSLDYSVARFGINQSFQNPPIRIFRTMNETNLNFSANLEIPLNDIFGTDFTFKTGTLIERIDRSFNEEWILYQPLSNFFPNRDLNGDPYLYDPNGDPNSPYERLVGYDSTAREPILYLDYQSPEVNSYTATQDVDAFYGMVDFKLFKKLRVITGVRVEHSQLLALPKDTSETTLRRFQGEYRLVNGLPDNDTTVNDLTFEDFGIDETDFLPSMNLVYELNENTNLRAAYYRTLARPNLREMAPYTSFEFVGGFLNTGNPFLKRVLIDNFDLRFEWFPNIGEILALSVYYKDFTNPIERGIVSVNNEIRFLNAESAQLFGAEFEIRKNLGNLVESVGGKSNKLLKNLDLSFNLTLTEAQVDIPVNSRDAQALIDYRQDILDFAREQDSIAIVDAGGTDFSDLPSTVVDTNDVLKRDFVGQSPYVVNFDVSYTNPELGLNISSNFNVFGRRLDFVQLGRNPDVYEVPRPELNFIVSKVFYDNLKVKFAANNLLNPYTKFVQTHEGVDYVARQFRRGTSMSLSMSYTFN